MKSTTFFPLFNIVLILLIIFSFSNAEEKSLWQKFKDFFSPMPTIEGEGPEFDEIRNLDKKINTLEGKYSRERRPNNKKIIKKELDSLKVEREILATKIKNLPSSSSNANSLSNCMTDTLILHDTLFRKDTFFIHDTIVLKDTLYVILSDKNHENNITDNSKSTSDSTQVNQVPNNN